MSLPQFSQPVNPSLYHRPDYLSSLHPRISQHAEIADEVHSFISQAWLKAPTSGEEKAANPGLTNPVSGNAMALIFPESSPAKLRALAFLWEFLVVQDGEC